jgi:hypothetical protein
MTWKAIHPMVRVKYCFFYNPSHSCFHLFI